MKMTEKQTPIEDILLEDFFSKSRAKQLCKTNKITTAEQLATFNRFRFRIWGNFRLPEEQKNFMQKTLDYLERCLKRVGMSFAPETPQSERIWSQYKIYGEQNTKNDLLTALNQIGSYATVHKISTWAKRSMIRQLEPYEERNGEKLFSAYSFANSVFATKITRPYLEQFVAEGKAEKIETKKGLFYRAKNNL